MSALGSPSASAADGLQVLRLLGGHSGATVALCARGNDRFVRKTAAGAGTNPRLRQQAIKQRLFAAQGFPLPQVRDIGRDDEGRAYFDMEYVPSRTIAEHVLAGEADGRAKIVDGIAQLLWIFRSGVSGVLAEDVFLAKIASSRDAALASEAASAHRDAIVSHGARLLCLDWTGIPASPGHGDLTLENILADAGEVMFIDCDEPFASSYWLDFAKLFQDVDGLWCLREASGDVAAPRAVLSQLGGDLRVLAREANRALPARLSQMTALHLFRALAYAKTEALARFICDAIARLLEGA